MTKKKTDSQQSTVQSGFLKDVKQEYQVAEKFGSFQTTANWLKLQKHAFQMAMSGHSIIEALAPLAGMVFNRPPYQTHTVFEIVAGAGEKKQLFANIDGAHLNDINEGEPELLLFYQATSLTQPVIIYDVEDGNDWEHLRAMARKRKCRACWYFPLQLEDGPILGLLALYFVVPHQPDTVELQMAGALADTATIIIALKNELKEPGRVQGTLQKNQEQKMFLLKLSEVLRTFAEPAEIKQAASRILGEHLQVNRVIYAEVEEGEANAILAICGQYVRNVPVLPDHVPYSVYTPGFTTELYQNEITVVVNDVQSDSRFDETIRAGWAALNIRAAVVVISRKQGRNTVVFAVHSSSPRTWAKTEAALVAEAAWRTLEAAERARIEANFRQSNVRTQMIIEAGTVSISFYNSDCVLIDANEVFVNTTGWTREDIASGKIIWETMTPPEWGDLTEQQMVTLKRTGHIGAYEREYIFKNGMRSWMLSAGRNLGDGSIVIFSIDINDRKHAEGALREIELQYRIQLEKEVRERTAELLEGRDQLRSVLDTTLIQMSILEAVRDEKGNIVDLEIRMVNKELEKETGRNDLVGKLYAGEYPGIKQAGLFNLIVKAIETGEPQATEYFYPYEGFNKWFSCMFVKLGDGVVASNMDITRRKQAEEDLRKLQAEQHREILRITLNTLEEERHRIAESLHNGIGQILYGIKISLAGLLQELPEKEFNANKDYTNRLLTDAIRETRRVSHELMPATLEEFGLQNAILDICQQLNHTTRFDCKFYGLKNRLEKYLELAVYRTVQELMTNVVKHARATDATIEIAAELNQVRIKVHDNGQGMDTDKTTKTGIGLIAIKNKISLLNGTVQIESRKGKGTLVEIIIPMPEKRL